MAHGGHVPVDFSKFSDLANIWLDWLLGRYKIMDYF